VGPAPDLVRIALEVPRLTVTRMATELGIPRATLEAYRLGTRRMPAAMRARLGAYLAEHARVLRALADALRADPMAPPRRDD
jgi:plasmid maintenance system antidote protein VapI